MQDSRPIHAGPTGTRLGCEPLGERGMADRAGRIMCSGKRVVKAICDVGWRSHRTADSSRDTAALRNGRKVMGPGAAPTADSSRDTAALRNDKKVMGPGAAPTADSSRDNSRAAE